MNDHQKTLAIKFALGFAIVTALGGWQGASFAGMCLSWGLYGIFFYWLYFHGPAAADRLESLQNRLKPLRLPFLILVLAVLSLFAVTVLTGCRKTEAKESVETKPEPTYLEAVANHKVEQERLAAAAAEKEKFAADCKNMLDLCKEQLSLVSLPTPIWIEVNTLVSQQSSWALSGLGLFDEKEVAERIEKIKAEHSDEQLATGLSGLLDGLKTVEAGMQLQNASVARQQERLEKAQALMDSLAPKTE